MLGEQPPMPQWSAKVCSSCSQICRGGGRGQGLASRGGIRVCGHLPRSRGHECSDRGGCNRRGVGMGVGLQPWSNGARSLRQPPSHPQFPKFLTLSVGSLAEIPKE